MNQIGNILVAVGQFPQDDPVLGRAAEIARAHRAKLTIIHVVDSIGEISPAVVDLTSVQHQIQQIGLERVQAAVKNSKAVDLNIDIRIEVGSPHVRVIEVAKELNVDLVVMRAHQHDSILDKIIGSTTDRVIRVSCAPVLVVKRPVKQAYQHVVVAIDTSDDSAAIVPTVAALFTMAELSLIHVVQIPQQFEAAMLRAGSGQCVAEHRTALIDNAKVRLHDISNTLTKRPVQSAARVVVGNPATSLVRATWSADVDLIALGPGSTSTIWRALLGSVTRRVLRTATCDVLICPSASLNGGK